MPRTPNVHFEAASSLAVVVSSNEPLLFLSDDQKATAASASFCRAFEVDPATVPGKRLSELGNGEWAMPNLASLLKVTVSGSAQIEAYEIDLKRPKQKTQNLVVNARTLDDGDTDHIRLLLAAISIWWLLASRDPTGVLPPLCASGAKTASASSGRRGAALSCP